jgi:hypothetical protein
LLAGNLSPSNAHFPTTASPFQPPADTSAGGFYFYKVFWRQKVREEQTMKLGIVIAGRVPTGTYVERLVMHVRVAEQVELLVVPHKNGLRILSLGQEFESFGDGLPILNRVQARLESLILSEEGHRLEVMIRPDEKMGWVHWSVYMAMLDHG